MSDLSVPVEQTAPPGVLFDSAFVDVESAAQDCVIGDATRRQPTRAELDAGNYTKGRVAIGPFRCVIESPRGTIRSGTDKGGKEWRQQMPAHYGYIAGTKGNDGDEVDCFIGLFPGEPIAYVINQYVGGRFDEHKVMFGFPSEEAARRTYREAYAPGWRGLDSLIALDFDQLRAWLRHGPMHKPISVALFDGTAAMTKKVLWDSAGEPIATTLPHILYALRLDDADDGLLLDPMTPQEMAEAFDVQPTPLFDGIVVTKAMLGKKMNALARVMGLAASEDVKPVGVTIGEPRLRRMLYAGSTVNIDVIFSLQDGQTVTVCFHNPDSTPTKLLPGDDLISWKWLLNKRDVTIVVAPERGTDLNIREVARRIARLAEKNHATFLKANASTATRAERVQALEAEEAVLDKQLDRLSKDIDTARFELENLRGQRQVAVAAPVEPVVVVPTPDAVAKPELLGLDVPVLDAPLQEVIEKARRYALANFGSMVVTNRDDGEDIILSPGGIKHALSSGAGLTDALVITDLANLVINAKHDSEEPDKRNRANIKAVHLYTATADVLGEMKEIGLIVREHHDNRRYYDHFELKNKSPSSTSGDSLASEDADQSHRPLEGDATDSPPAAEVSQAVVEEPAVVVEPVAEPAQEPAAVIDVLPPAAEPAQQPALTVELAAAMGAAAFAEGRSSAPAQDVAFRAAMASMHLQVGESLPYVDAWIAAWHASNLANAREAVEVVTEPAAAEAPSIVESPPDPVQLQEPLIAVQDAPNPEAAADLAAALAPAPAADAPGDAEPAPLVVEPSPAAEPLPPAAEPIAPAEVVPDPVLAEEPAPAETPEPESVDQRAVDLGYLGEVRDGAIDYQASDIAGRLEAIYNAYPDDAEMQAQILAATEAYQDFIAAAAQALLSGST